MTIGMLEDGTAIGTALASAVNRLRDSTAASRLVVLLTDGENNMGNISPEQAAQAAAALGIRVYTIGAGTDGWVPIPFTDRFGQVHYRRAWSEIDEPTLREIASVTGGSYFRATDHRSLKKIYEEIDRMERTEVDVEHYTQFEPRHLPFLISGLLCLGLEKLLAMSRLGRLP
jgi:Ca-activated chloride channel family protein